MSLVRYCHFGVPKVNYSDSEHELHLPLTESVCLQGARILPKHIIILKTYSV